jgi:hypothetical protein
MFLRSARGDTIYYFSFLELLCGVKTRGLPHRLLGHERSAKAGNASNSRSGLGSGSVPVSDPDRSFHVIPDLETLNQGQVKKYMFTMGLKQDFKAFVISFI